MKSAVVKRSIVVAGHKTGVSARDFGGSQVPALARRQSFTSTYNTRVRRRRSGAVSGADIPNKPLISLACQP
jgi:hypothetical protein